MPLFNYNRPSVLEYAQTWSRLPNPLYPDLSLSFGNNVSFLYQCVFNGGYFSEGSRYIDHSPVNKYPVISKVSNFTKALTAEVGAVVTKASNDSHKENIQTGDIVFVYKVGGGLYGAVAHKTNQGTVFYAVDQLLYGKPLPPGDTYVFYEIPNLGGA